MVLVDELWEREPALRAQVVKSFDQIRQAGQILVKFGSASRPCGPRWSNYLVKFDRLVKFGFGRPAGLAARVGPASPDTRQYHVVKFDHLVKLDLLVNSDLRILSSG